MDKPLTLAPNDQPIRRFARFFKGYNVSLSLVVAAIPVLIAVWDLVPLYATSKNQLTLVTSVGSYLLVGFIFSQRTTIGRFYFPRGGKGQVAYSRDVRRSLWFGQVPLVLAVLSLISFFLYFHTINSSIERIAYENAVYTTPMSESVSPNATPSENTPRTSICEVIKPEPGKTRVVDAEFHAFDTQAVVTISCKTFAAQQEDQQPVYKYTVALHEQKMVTMILAHTPSPSIPYSFLASVSFLSAFLLATSAFILMGLKEYTQEDLGLRDQDLYPKVTTIEKRFEIEGVPGLYGVVEFSPADDSLPPRVEGPFCTWHKETPKPKSFDDKGTVTGWIHVHEIDRKQVVVNCPLETPLSEGELRKRLDKGAKDATTD